MIAPLLSLVEIIVVWLLFFALFSRALPQFRKQSGRDDEVIYPAVGALVAAIVWHYWLRSLVGLPPWNSLGLP